MPRPPKEDSEKRRLIGARFDPGVREKLDSYTAESGRSAGAEVERRVRATIALDEAGLELIESICSEIAEIESAHEGRRWHEDLVVWSAVVHMIRTGPIMLHRPESPNDDEVVSRAYKRLEELEGRRKHLLDQAADCGLAWLERPNTQRAGQSGGRLGLSGGRGLLGGNVAVDARKAERATIESLEASLEKDELARLHEQLCVLDGEIEEAKAKWTGYLRTYWDAEEEGREWNRRRQMARAQKAFREGGDFDMHQLGGADPWHLAG